MKRKLICIGVTSMLLLVCFATLTTATETREFNEINDAKRTVKLDESIKRLEENFSIKIRGGLFGVHILVESITGESRIGDYEVKFDYRLDWKDSRISSSFTAGPDSPGELDCSSHQFGFGRVTAKVSIGGQYVEKHGFCYGLLCFTILI